ncbi:uncharacterized protein LOC121387557 [Gigantopelta aegis]|uniref:uncharacterized protein LOC121387557 n=1 Tax=Gigantopelta aegis TaxID=1735272 RepID=UPI001B8875C7|nr:uncharacterized protein LOC121387557 [Gigantopelta aegis]
MASGIAEHHEALRRQNMLNRRAYITKQLMEKYGDDYVPDYQVVYPRNTYTEEQQSDPKMTIRKMGSPPGMSDYKAPITDKLRRDQVREQEMAEYTAKLPDRFRSINYVQQW